MLSIGQLSDQTAPDLDRRTLDDCFSELDGQEHIAAVPRPGIWRTIITHRLAGSVAAAILIVGAFVGISHVGISPDGATVAWADVVEKFNSITFFSAAVYIKENATDEPTQIEIWRNSRNKARIRVDGQVLFADGADIVAGYAIDGTLRKIGTEEYNEMGMAMARKLFSFPHFSLDTVIGALGISKESLKETTPLINPAAMISEDMLVFDAQSDISPEWVRIWVLRESRLPIRIRYWDPRDGDCVDALVSYSVEQSPEFFDPNAYEQLLLDVQKGSEAGGRMNLAYALLKDPGGKDYTPKDLFDKAMADSEADDSEDISGYHLPKVEQAGVTEYGAVWVVASRSRNRMPDGQTFYGFSDVSDNLQRKYHSVESTHWANQDVSLQVFVPDDYPLDAARPESLALRCSVEATGPYERETLVGSVKLDSWQKNTLWPQKWLKKGELDAFLRQARRKTGDRAACEKILRMLRQLDTQNAHSHEIEKVRLRMLIEDKKYEEAALLAERLLPAEYDVFRKAKGNAGYYEFYDYVVAVAAGGDYQRAADIFRDLKDLKPDLSPYNGRAQQHIMERLNDQLHGGSTYALIRPLFAAGLDVEQVTGIVGFDVLENEKTKWYVPEKYRRQRDPRVIRQEAYKNKLTEQYGASPLAPGQMVLNPCTLKEVGYLGPVPDVNNHYFYVFSMPLHDFLKGYKSAGQEGRTNRVRVAEGVENPMMQHEIIYNSPAGFKWDLCREFVMSQFGLEAVEGTATGTVLVAEYDGSQRKDYRDVRCPAIRGSTSTPGMMSFMTRSGISLESVLASLARDQGLLVVNNTGIDDRAVVTCEMANFKTARGMELAEKWFKENFGITFHREERTLPIWTIRKKP